MSAAGVSPADQGVVECTVTDRIAHVVISNQSKRNALTQHMCLELKDLMHSLTDDPSVALVAVSGAGPDFSAGASIEELPSILFEQMPDGGYVDHFSAADSALTQVKKPTVALVQGVCMGGGWQIASACDFIVASSNATFAVTPAKIGILYPRSGVDRLVRHVGPARAKYILMTGKTFTACQAQDLGLIADVVKQDEFGARTNELLEVLLKRSRFTQIKTKEYIDAPSPAAQQADAIWSRNWSEMIEGEDRQVGVEAFRQRIEPRFTWTAPAEQR
ncbi:enoyl-CoA hydratase/isomerase family protein [Nesterenkonia muleiensis]|uniref:enoyl-CoA hydratase/isomerase family protein n=1 Tax=Nesterenkonia muleiensis TaxID=2282648 RepID=UPI000E70CF05|nr:enoyl-CoA hydratase/isomerase family protein [Nesterenkonia muleiensis]